MGRGLMQVRVGAFPFGGPGPRGPARCAIHSSAWKGYSRNFGCSIMHKPVPRGTRMACEGLHAAWQGSTHLVVVHEDAARRIGYGPKSTPGASYVPTPRGEARNEHKNTTTGEHGENGCPSMSAFYREARKPRRAFRGWPPPRLPSAWRDRRPPALPHDAPQRGCAGSQSVASRPSTTR